MAMSQTPQARSNGFGTGFDVPSSMARSFALAFSPFTQGLRLYADFQRSALAAFTRATGATVDPVMATADRPKPAAKPAAKPAPRKRATTTKPAATKRPTTTKPAATKRPTTTKPAATKRTTTTTKPAAKATRSAPAGSNGQSASKKPAAAKAAPKRNLKRSTPGTKPAVAKVTKKAASKPSRPRSTRTNAAKKA
jgi:hypothetical protein